MKLTPLAQLGLLIPVAILIWLAVFSLSYHSFTLDIPITLKGLPSGLAVEENLTTISATIRAKNMAYYQMRMSKNTQAVVELSFIDAPGNYNVKPQITLDANDVWLVSFSPEVIAINVVPAVSVTVPVAVDPIGFPAAGYALGDIIITPDKVALIGPASLVNTIQEVYVGVNVAGKQNSYSVQGVPEVRDTAGAKLANVRFTPTEVNVNVTIAKGEIFKTIGLTPVFSGNLPSGYWVAEVNFTPPAVTLRSSIKRLDAISSVKTTAINLVGKTNDFSDQIGLEIPDGVTLVGENLINVTVKIGSSPFNRKLVIIPHGINVTPGLKVVSMSPTTIDVTLSGPAEELNKADRDTVVLDLDLRSATSGDNTMTIDKSMFRVPDKVSVISFEPTSLQVSLTKTK